MPVYVQMIHLVPCQMRTIIYDSLRSFQFVGMVLNIALDYMHLICLGVTRKLVYLWIRVPLAT